MFSNLGITPLFRARLTNPHDGLVSIINKEFKASDHQEENAILKNREMKPNVELSKENIQRTRKLLLFLMFTINAGEILER